MDVLSTKDGSAQAIAAAASEAVDSRIALERELDRLNAALGAHATASAQHLHWTLLSQAFLLASYLIVLVGAWALPLPGKRWLLAALAGYAIVTLVFGHLSQRGSRDRIAPLRQSRRLVEQALERIVGRPPVFSRDGGITRSVGDWATTLTPVVALAGWFALVMYTLALPVPADGRAAVDAKAGPRAAAPVAQPTAGVRPRGTPRKAEEVEPPPVADTAPPAEESGLAAMFRRALNTPPAADSGDAVKP
jgi:hypothetical protein